MANSGLRRECCVCFVHVLCDFGVVRARAWMIIFLWLLWHHGSDDRWHLHPSRPIAVLVFSYYLMSFICQLSGQSSSCQILRIVLIDFNVEITYLVLHNIVLRTFLWETLITMTLFFFSLGLDYLILKHKKGHFNVGIVIAPNQKRVPCN